MGAAFSPTVANIFLFVILKKFIQTQHTTPIFLAYFYAVARSSRSSQVHERSFHLTLHFTYECSQSSIDYFSQLLDNKSHRTYTVPTLHILTPTISI